ncbi:MAG: hypothetical protein ACXWJM_07050 [Ramlibacter sp.]
MKPVLSLAIVLATVMATSASYADPLRDDHPLVGTWRIDLKSVNCHEIYRIRKNGTTLVTSSEEVAESEFVMSDQPSPKGFYKWVDKITKDNGKKDCMGEAMQLGHEATNYIRLHPSGKMFLMCEQEDMNTCIGPLVRVKDDDV